jgi:hypothetical protein
MGGVQASAKQVCNEKDMDFRPFFGAVVDWPIPAFSLQDFLVTKGPLQVNNATRVLKRFDCLVTLFTDQNHAQVCRQSDDDVQRV